MICAVTAILVLSQNDPLSIMQKVAANTSSAVESRRRYVYRQRVRSSLLQTNGKLLCKESREYTVIPQAATTERNLVAFTGECREGKKMVSYQKPDDFKPGMSEKGISGDRETIAGVVNDLAARPDTRDGIPRQLFPLSSDDLVSYRFILKGETTIQGRRAYDITFEPAAHKGVCIDAGDEKSAFTVHLHGNSSEAEQAACRPWKGEVWADATEFQPIRIDTRLAKEVPWGVRVFMGINIRQLGFSLSTSAWPKACGSRRRTVPNSASPSSGATNEPLPCPWKTPISGRPLRNPRYTSKTRNHDKIPAMSTREFYVERRRAEDPVFLKVLRALPADQLSYKPHERSPSAEQNAWTVTMELKACLDVVKNFRAEWQSPPAPPLSEMVRLYEEWSKELTERVAAMDDASWQKTAQFYYEGKLVLEQAAGEFLWFILFDAIHHRGQLSAYLRPMGGRVPAIYGPSADEQA